MEQFILRASKAGSITTNPKDKTALIAKGVESFVYEWVKEQIYGVRKEIKSKYLTKGLTLEDEAIDRAIEWLDLNFTIKNDKRFTDEYFTGEPDLIIGDTVYDIKCSWDCFTFPLFDTEVPTPDYFYQLQVYMHLTGCKKAVLTYVLLNTPPELTYEAKYNYDELDKKYRIKTFEFDFDKSIIDDLKSRVDKIREFIKQIKY